MKGRRQRSSVATRAPVHGRSCTGGMIGHCLLVWMAIHSSFLVADAAKEHALRGHHHDPRKTTKINRKQGQIIPQAKARLPLVAKSGTHHLQLYVGQPPMKQTLIVDTGSRLAAWTCQPCRECGRHASGSSGYYNPQESTTSSVRVKMTALHAASSCRRNNDASSCHFEGFSFCSQDKTRCLLEQRYTEGSTWSAYEMTDLVTIGVADALASSNSSVETSYEASLPYTIPFTFGCQTSLSGLFKEQYADGILGLEHSDYVITKALAENGAFDDDDDEDEDDVYSRSDGPEKDHNKQQLLLPQRPNKSAFSLCLSTDGGWMGVGGGALVDRHTQRMQTTPMVEPNLDESSDKKKTRYAVTVTEVWLGDTRLAGPAAAGEDSSSDQILKGFASGKGTILDSGTTDTFLNARISRVMKDEWQKQTDRYLEDRTDNYTLADFEKLPPMKLVFSGNVSLTVPPMNYMEGASSALWNEPSSSSSRRLKQQQQKQQQEAFELTNRIYVDETMGAVLGINSMLDHDILFDWEGGSIGIAPADCS